MRRPHRGPTAYPVACAPQAWAAAAPFALLAACLGLELAHERHQVRLRDPVMPDFLSEVVLRNLRLGNAAVDVRLHRYGSDVSANIIGREGSLRVVTLK
jgi:glycogen debranching enzyme